jgi:hypothetical protein
LEGTGKLRRDEKCSDYNESAIWNENTFKEKGLE